MNIVPRSELNRYIKPGTRILVATNPHGATDADKGYLPRGFYSHRDKGSLRLGTDFQPIRSGFGITIVETGEVFYLITPGGKTQSY